MSYLEKIGLAIVGLATVTTLILPRRQTGTVITAGAKGFQGILGTAMGSFAK